MKNHTTYIMQTCYRPHCAIRSHNHNFTFADFLELDDYYRNVAHSFKNDISEKNIDNYEILSDNLSKYNRHTCCLILKKTLDFFNEVKCMQDLELKKLGALYVFSMCRTIHITKFMHTENSTIKEAIYGAYDRILKEGYNDKRFVSEMEKLSPF